MRSSESSDLHTRCAELTSDLKPVIRSDHCLAVVRGQEHAQATPRGSVYVLPSYSSALAKATRCLLLVVTVNEKLKAEIAELHAFTQVR